MVKTQKEGDMLFVIPATISGVKNDCKSERYDYNYQNSNYKVGIHFYNLLMFFVSASQSGIKDNCKCKQTDCNNQINYHNIVFHAFTPFARYMLISQHEIVSNIPTNNFTISKLTGEIKYGITIEANITSPITINTSHTLSSCESENSSFMKDNDTIVNSVKSRVFEEVSE